MKGFKNFDCANSIIADIETIDLLHKNQSVFSIINGRLLSIAEQINLIAV